MNKTISETNIFNIIKNGTEFCFSITRRCLFADAYKDLIDNISPFYNAIYSQLFNFFILIIPTRRICRSLLCSHNDDKKCKIYLIGRR